jgi:hypothetical protein
LTKTFSNIKILLGGGMISWVLLGNAFHSNVYDEKLKEFIDDKGGLEVLKEFKIPVTFGVQKIDTLLFPEVYGVPKEVCNGLFSHVLALLLPTEHLRWQKENGIKGTVPITFYPEFAVNPHCPDLLENPLILDPGTRYYFWERNQDVKVSPIPKNPCIKLGRTRGVRAFGFESLRDSWHRFQLVPNKETLENLLKAVKASSESQNYIIWPMDWETPVVGSVEKPSVIFRIFLESLEKEGLIKNFLSLKDVFEKIKTKVEKSAFPFRETAKWTSSYVQIQYFSELKKVKEKENPLFALAAISDVFSAWRSKIDPPVQLPARSLSGAPAKVTIGFNQSVIDICLSAFKALKTGRSFKEILRETGTESPLKQRILSLF